jgi:hypothetical protein
MRKLALSSVFKSPNDARKHAAAAETYLMPRSDRMLAAALDAVGKGSCQ